jgi:hypothetical protein
MVAITVTIASKTKMKLSAIKTPYTFVVTHGLVPL